MEEIMTEGTMLLSGVDLDIRFGKPIRVDEYLQGPEIQKELETPIPEDFDTSAGLGRVPAAAIIGDHGTVYEGYLRYDHRQS